MRQVLFTVSLLAEAASVPLVAQGRYLADAPGTWKPWKFNAYADTRRLLGARPADVKDLEAQLLRLSAIINKADGLTNPVGFSIETAGDLGVASGRLSAAAGAPALTALPLPATFNFGAYPVMQFGSGATARRDDTGETAQLLFFVNDLSQPLFASADHSVPEFEDLDVDVALLARPQPDVFGLARYGGDTLVIKKSAAPIWTAVTLAETLELVTRSIDRRLAGERDSVGRLQAQYDDFTDPGKREQRIAQYRKIAPLQKDPAYLDKMAKMEAAKEQNATALLPGIARAGEIVTESEQELADATAMTAGLSAADKAVPCYSRGAQSLSRFRRAPAPGCDPLVRPNWALFNPALPRSAPQLLTIANFEQCLVADRAVLHVGGCTANRRLLESIDKAALLAWLQ